jgi:ribonuclease HII
MSVAGVDEAGRGAIIGPLVVAGVLVKEGDLQKLREIGVKDSKLLSPRRRETLAEEIKRIAQKHHITKLSPREIDKVVEKGRKLRRLNWLEAQAMAKVIDSIKPQKVYVDASDILEHRFKQQILECLSYKTEIISEHKADRNYTVVSAASIIAKVERDREIAELAKAHGDLGSGYPSDPSTMDFLTRCLEKSAEYPCFVRRSWKPAKKKKSERGTRQTELIRS